MLPTETKSSFSQQTLESMRFPVSYVSFSLGDCSESELEIFLSDIGLTVEDLNTPNQTINGVQFKAFLEAALDDYHEPTPASLAIAKNFNVGTHGLFGLALVSSSNLREALETGLEFSSLMMPAIDFYFEAGESYSACFIECHPDFGRGCALLSEISIAVVASFLKHSSPTILPEEIHFQHACSSSPELYVEYFGCDVIFASDGNKLIVSNGCGDNPMNFQDVSTLDSLKTQLNVLLENQQRELASSSWKSKVRNCIRSQEGRWDLLSKSFIAEQFNLTPRTLTRKLQQEDTCYKDILDEVKRQMALEKLENTDLSISAIAYELGFKEPQAFSRAFKRWTGKSASAMRRKG